MAAGPSIGSAYLRVMPDTSGLNARMAAYFRSSDWGKLGKAAGLALGAGVAAAGVGKALYEVGQAFDDVYDDIRVETGKTGKQLEGLKDSFREVVRAVPADFDTAGKAVSGLNQRLGLTGKPLERLSKQLTELSRITETDVEENVTSVTRAFGDWEVKTRKQSKTLDFFFRASQASGASVSELTQLIVQFGAPLRRFGFSVEEATSMFALFEKSGVNIQTMIPGLKLALSEFLEAGRDPQKALAKTFAGIESGAIKADEAIEIFGKRAGADMVEAIEQGRFKFEEFTRTIRRGDDTIRKAGRQTMDLGEHWTRFKNNVLLALEPVATRVFEGIGDAMKDVTKIMSDPNLTSAEKFDKFLDLVSKAISNAVPKLIDLGGKAAGAVVKGFLNAGIWGSVAAAALLFRMLGGGSAVTAAVGGVPAKTAAAATTAGGTMAAKVGAGFRAGALRLGLAGAILGGISAATQGGGVGDRFQNFFSGLTLGIVPQAKDWGTKLAGAITDAFGPALEKAITARSIPALRALSTKLDSVIGDFEEMGAEVPSALRDMASKGDRNLERLELAADEAGDSIEHLRNRMFHSLGDIRQETDKNMRQIKKSLGSQSAEGRALISQNFDAAVAAIRRSMDAGLVSVRKGNKAIKKVLTQQLRAYGISDPEGFMTRSESVAKAGGSSPRGKQRGGVIVPGQGSGDTVPAMLEPGEVVWNREAVKALGGTRIADMVNKLIPRFARGGIVSVPGFPGERISSKVLGAWQALQKRFKLFLTDAYGPGHASAEHTQYGTAVDVAPGPGGSWSDVGRAVGYSVKQGYTPVYYDGSRGSINLPPHGPGHHAHITLLTAAELLAGVKPGGGSAAVFAGKLKLPRFEGKFPLGDVAAAGLNKVAAGAEKAAAERLSRMAPREGAEMGSVMTGSGDVERVFAKVAKRLSRSKIATLALGMAGYAESGMQDLPGGHSSSQGALQLLASTAAGLGVSPHDEAAIASLFFQRGFYGKGGANALAAQGLPAHLVAQGVQGSAFASGSNYLAQARPAKAWMQRFRLQKGGIVDLWGTGLAQLARGGVVGPGGPGGRGSSHAQNLARMIRKWNALGDRERLRRARKDAKWTGKEWRGTWPGKGQGYEMLEDAMIVPGDKAGKGAGGQSFLERARKIAKQIGRLTRGVARTDERIDIAQRLASLETSPAGAELSAGELAAQIRLLSGLLEQLQKLRGLSAHGLRLTGKGKGKAKGPLAELATTFRDTLAEMAGLTGKGGRIFDTKLALAELRGSAAAGKSPMSIAELLGFAEAVRYGAFNKQMPPFGGSFRDGGVVPGPVGAPRTIVAHGGEEVGPRGGRRYELTITNWDEGRGYITEVADDRISESDRAGRGIAIAGVLPG